LRRRGADAVFHYDVRDHNTCMLRRCSVPSLSLWREAGDSDIMVPYMYGINHRCAAAAPRSRLPKRYTCHRDKQRALQGGARRGRVALRAERAFPHPRSAYTFPWEQKERAHAFFRGRDNAHPRPFPSLANATFSSRPYLANLTLAHPDALDVRLLDAPDPAMRGEEVKIREHARHAFLLSLDGITGSFRYGRILHANSVILKEASPWEEYFYRGLKPGVHYLSVFDGAPDDVLAVLAAAQRDDAASRAMAAASQAFAVRNLCPRARMLYFRAALRAYVRLFGASEGDDAMGRYVREQAWPATRARIAAQAAADAVVEGR
jgi:hypothetical protein